MPLHCCCPAVLLPCSGVRMGCYANGFQTTTTQWMSGAEQPLLQSDPGECAATASAVAPY